MKPIEKEDNSASQECLKDVFKECLHKSETGFLCAGLPAVQADEELWLSMVVSQLGEAGT